MPIGVYKRASALDRWSANVLVAGGGCWMWLGSVDSDGYGRFWWDGRTGKATHFALINAGHPRPQNGYALHSCHNSSCVRSDHLRWGTPAENMDDKVLAGHSKCNSGESNAHARLNPDKVRKIRADGRRVLEIADEYGVTIAAVYSVKQRRTWAHVA